MDEFKKYIRDHAKELDIDEPREQVWQNIARQAQPAPKASVVLMVTRWAAAACILALAGIGAWSVFHTQRQSHTETAAAAPQKPIDTPAQQPMPEQPLTAQNHEQPEERREIKRETVTHRKQKTNEQKPQQQAAWAALQNIETSFTQVINLQRERVSSMPMYAESPEYFSDFKVQIRQMERDEKTIKSDIAKRGMTDELLDQLINLYQQKLNTLKQLQIEMNKTNNRYKQNHGVVDPAKTYFLNL